PRRLKPGLGAETRFRASQRRRFRLAFTRPPARPPHSFRSPLFSHSTMSHIPADLLFAKSHEWIKIAPDGTALVGITDYAQSSLGDITFVQLPKVGASFAAGETFGVVESVKAASDLYAPVACTVLEINSELDAA